MKSAKSQPSILSTQVWQDGEIKQKPTGEARLLSDQGQVISSSKAPKGSLEPFAEGRNAFLPYDLQPRPLKVQSLYMFQST